METEIKMYLMAAHWPTRSHDQIIHICKGERVYMCKFLTKKTHMHVLILKPIDQAKLPELCR